MLSFNKIKNKKGRPRKERGFNNVLDDMESDDYMKTIVLNVRVSYSEKNYIKNLTRSKSDNVSSYVRRLIFDVYSYKLNTKETLINHVISRDEYTFNEPRSTFIYIRLTEVEKKEIERLALMYHRSVSEFIRWICIQVPIDELLYLE